MKWNDLLSAKRWGYKNEKNYDPQDERSQFQRDYDRLIFSSPFRKLQDKTQVFPLPGPALVHNRLTHSLEVASVGRSLGNLFYNRVKKAQPNIDSDNPFMQEIGNIVSSACLCHDLGNPAFGHSGEDAISSFFTMGLGKKYQELVTPEQWQDLIHFEGNANALRILTHGFRGQDPNGYALTYSTLASIVKYPCRSIDGHQKNLLHRNKYGFFDTEKEVFASIAKELGIKQDPENILGYMRHPLVYLVEAADDICYNIIDLEDAYNLKLLNYSDVEKMLSPFCGDQTNLMKRLGTLGDESSKVSLLRAKAINTLINGCVEVFANEGNQEKILSGSYNTSLIKGLNQETVMHLNTIKDLSKKYIYNALGVVQIEIAGFKVLNALLEEFVPAYLTLEQTAYDKKIVALIPENFLTESNNPYKRIRSVLDYISAMTDIYAVDLFRKIRGIQIASIS